MPGRTTRQVHLETLGEGLPHREGQALVFVDLFLASTSVVTSCAQGRRTWLAPTADEGRRRARGLPRPILAGEPGLALGPDIDTGAGPSRLLDLDAARPFVLVCPWVSLLPAKAPAVFVACLRNMQATVSALAEFDDVAVVGAGYRGRVRSEDQMVAAWIANRLVGHGYRAGDLRTEREIARWAKADVSMLALGRGADHLRRLGRDEDLEFVLRRVDDLDLACRYAGAEVEEAWRVTEREAAATAN
jgi:phosphosulfolactate phosphohydrolase-like enzyme